MVPLGQLLDSIQQYCIEKDKIDKLKSSKENQKLSRLKEESVIKNLEIEKLDLMVDLNSRDITDLELKISKFDGAISDIKNIIDIKKT